MKNMEFLKSISLTDDSSVTKIIKSILNDFGIDTKGQRVRGFCSSKSEINSNITQVTEGYVFQVNNFRSWSKNSLKRLKESFKVINGKINHQGLEAKLHGIGDFEIDDDRWNLAEIKFTLTEI